MLTGQNQIPVPPPGPAAAPGRLAQPGRNCWRLARADRAAFLVDGDAYFRAVKAAMAQARRSVLLVGWDIHSGLTLDRGGAASEPNRLAPLLDHLVCRRRDLRVHVLVWESALLYSLDREFWPAWNFNWRTPRRLRFHMDDAHPLGASQHQKIVVIDDKLAFVGGLDLTAQRWDTPEHRMNDPRRSDAGGYPPFHDVMAMVAGPVARDLGDLARLRWRRATGQVIPPPPSEPGDPWPDFITPDVTGCSVAISRTMPAWEDQPEVREVEQLYLDMIGRAERFLYVENQYFASRRIGQCLLSRLSDRQACPEVAVVTPRSTLGLIERTTMGWSRDRLIGRLAAAPMGKRRFGVFYPAVPGGDVKVHSKMMIADDRLLRIGSSNLNNRSMGLDTECDLLFEDEGDGRVTRAIRTLRHRLLAEHLGRTPDEVAAAEFRRGSLLGAIEGLSTGERRLVPLEEVSNLDLLPGDSFYDPDRPLEAALWEADDPPPSPLPRPYAFSLGLLAALVLCLTAGALVWQEIPALRGLFHPRWAVSVLRDFGNDSWAPILAVLGMAGMGLAFVPVTLMFMLAGVIFGVAWGFPIALVGALLNGVLLFGAGRLLGRDAVRRITGRRATRVSRAFVHHGLLAVAMLRLVPASSYSVVNLVCGAAGLRLRDYLQGTALGVAPGAFLLALFGQRMAAMISNPGYGNAILLVLLAGGLAVLGMGLARRLAQAAPEKPPP